MPTLTAILLVSLAGVPPVQRGPSDWTSTNMSPLSFAKNIDNTILNLKNAYGKAGYAWKYFAGGSGTADFFYRIRDRKNFRVDFLMINATREDGFKAQRLQGYNGNFHLFTSGVGKTPLKSGSDIGVVPPNSNPLANWPMHFQQVMFQSYVNGRGAFQEMVSELTKKSSGFMIQMEKRTVQGNRGPIPQMRLMAKRTMTSAAKLGDASIEIVSDTGRWLPLQVRVVVTNKKRQTASFDWITQWKGPYKFDDTWFKN